jgi:hypothetical protein
MMVWFGFYSQKTRLVSPIRPPDKNLKSQIRTVLTVLKIQKLPGKLDLLGRNGLRIRAQHGQITPRVISANIDDKEEADFKQLSSGK